MEFCGLCSALSPAREEKSTVLLEYWNSFICKYVRQEQSLQGTGKTGEAPDSSELLIKGTFWAGQQSKGIQAVSTLLLPTKYRTSRLAENSWSVLVSSLGNKNAMDWSKPRELSRECIEFKDMLIRRGFWGPQRISRSKRKAFFHLSGL